EGAGRLRGRTYTIILHGHGVLSSVCAGAAHRQHRGCGRPACGVTMLIVYIHIVGRLVVCRTSLVFAGRTCAMRRMWSPPAISNAASSALRLQVVRLFGFTVPVISPSSSLGAPGMVRTRSIRPGDTPSPAPDTTTAATGSTS